MEISRAQGQLRFQPGILKMNDELLADEERVATLR
jgi:hypothetical protein